MLDSSLDSGLEQGLNCVMSQEQVNQVHSTDTNPINPVNSINSVNSANPEQQESSSCIFCSGLIPLLAGTIYNKRKRSLRSLAQFVSTRCRPTPYGYQHFSAVRGEARVLLCISCVNWQRRSADVERKKKAKPLLLLDQVALFMLEPGTVTFPDQRCVLRLLTRLRDPGDDWVPRLLLGLLPVPVQAMINMLPSPPCRADESVQKLVVRVWWEYNGRTVFFAHHLTAKLVRKMIRNSETPSLPAALPSPFWGSSLGLARLR